MQSCDEELNTGEVSGVNDFGFLQYITSDISRHWFLTTTAKLSKLRHFTPAQNVCWNAVILFPSLFVADDDLTLDVMNYKLLPGELWANILFKIWSRIPCFQTMIKHGGDWKNSMASGVFQWLVKKTLLNYKTEIIWGSLRSREGSPAPYPVLTHGIRQLGGASV